MTTIMGGATMEARRRARHKDPVLLSFKGHRYLIGLLGFLLAPVVVVWATVVAAEGLQASISAYYYTSAGDVFVGVMFASAAFLVTLVM